MYTKKLLLTVFATVLLGLHCHAQQVSTGGLTYALDDESLTATLTTFDEAPADSILVIPETVADSIGTKTYTVTAIGPKVFFGSNFKADYRTKMLGVKKIVVPKTVEVIGQQAFYINTAKDGHYGGSVCSLDELVFAEGSKLREIGEQAFNVNELDLPEGLTTIGRRVFYNNSRLTRIGIPSTVDSIAPQAFYGTSKLKEVSLPEGVRIIGDSAFMNMGGTTYASDIRRQAIPASVEKIGALAFNQVNRVKVTGSVPPAIQANTFKSGATVEAPIDLIDTYAQADVWKGLNVTGGSFTTDDGRSYTIIGSTTVRLDQFGKDLTPQLTIPAEVETVEYDGHVFTVSTYDFSTSRIVELNVERQYKSLPADWVFNSALKTLHLPSSIEMIDSLGTTFKNVSSLELFLTSPLPPKLGTDSYLSISALWLDEAYIPAYIGSVWRGRRLNPFSENGFGYCRLFTLEPEAAITATTGTSLTITDGMTVTHDGKEYAVTDLWGISDSLRELIVKSTKVSVDYSYFAQTKLERLEMAENGMTEIPSEYFKESNLKYIKLPSTIQTIGQYAFQRTTKLRHLELPEGLKTISFFAFMLTGLEEINLPASVDSIESNAFGGYNLQRISVAEGNQKYCDIDGVLFTKDKKTLMAWPMAKPQAHYDIPEGTELMASYAFISPTHLRSVRLPDSFQGVKKLGPRYNDVIYSFNSTLSIHVSSHTANLDDFNGYANQKIVYLPAAYTPYLYKYRHSITDYGQREFTDEDFILDQEEFEKCKEIIKAEIGEGDDWEIYNQALWMYRDSISGIISDMEKKYDLRTEDVLDAGVFEYTFNFKNENSQNPIGATVRAYLAPGMRAHVSIPKEVVFAADKKEWPNGWTNPSMTLEQREKFYDESEWPGYWHIPVTGIDYGVFVNDDKIETVSLPDSLQYIGEGAFFGCKNLKEVKGIDKMDETTRQTYWGIANFAFADCPQLQSILLAGNGVNASEVIGNKSLKSISLSDSLLARVNPAGCPTYTVDDGIVYINHYSYKTEIDEDGTIRKVCTNLPTIDIYPAGREATEFAVPDSIQEVSEGSMAYSRMEKLTLPASVNNIGMAALYGNSSLKELVLLADSVQQLPRFATQESYTQNYSGSTISYGAPYYFSGTTYPSSGLFGDNPRIIASEKYPSFDRDYTRENTVVLMKKAVIKQAEAQGNELYDQYKQWFKEVRAIDDGVVGIETVTANDSHKASNGWYTLDGHRVARPTTKGIYLHNGRKLIIR